MSKFKIGDLVKSNWSDENNYVDIDLGIVTDEIGNGMDDWTVYSIYWFQAAKSYPVFAHDLILVTAKQ